MNWWIIIGSIVVIVICLYSSYKLGRKRGAEEEHNKLKISSVHIKPINVEEFPELKKLIKKIEEEENEKNDEE